MEDAALLASRSQMPRPSQYLWYAVLVRNTSKSDNAEPMKVMAVPTPFSGAVAPTATSPPVAAPAAPPAATPELVQQAAVQLKQAIGPGYLKVLKDHTPVMRSVIPMPERALLFSGS